MKPSELRAQRGRRAAGAVPVFQNSRRRTSRITRENVSRDEIEQAAQEACLHEPSSGFQPGYETVVGERGVTLSGGQKQRTRPSRGRCWNTRRSWFLTTRFPPWTRRRTRPSADRLREAAGGSTMILIAHRIATLMQADQIIVLKDGQIVEQRHAAGAAGAERPVCADGADAVCRGRGGSRMSTNEKKSARLSRLRRGSGSGRASVSIALRLAAGHRSATCCSPSRIFTSRCCKAGSSINSF